MGAAGYGRGRAIVTIPLGVPGSTAATLRVQVSCLCKESVPAPSEHQQRSGSAEPTKLGPRQWVELQNEQYTPSVIQKPLDSALLEGWRLPKYRRRRQSAGHSPAALHAGYRLARSGSRAHSCKYLAQCIGRWPVWPHSKRIPSSSDDSCRLELSSSSRCHRVEIWPF